MIIGSCRKCPIFIYRGVYWLYSVVWAEICNYSRNRSAPTQARTIVYTHPTGCGLLQIRGYKSATCSTGYNTCRTGSYKPAVGAFLCAGSLQHHLTLTAPVSIYYCFRWFRLGNNPCYHFCGGALTTSPAYAYIKCLIRCDGGIESCSVLVKKFDLGWHQTSDIHFSYHLVQE